MDAICDEALIEIGFSESELKGFTKLLPPIADGAAIVEFCVVQHGDSGLWAVNLAQGVPDDPHSIDDIVAITSVYFRTMDQLRALLVALGSTSLECVNERTVQWDQEQTEYLRNKLASTKPCCWKCTPRYDRMMLCPTCGNKRCPHASDHELPCTDSNESGQAGSVYQ